MACFSRSKSSNICVAVVFVHRVWADALDAPHVEGAPYVPHPLAPFKYLFKIDL